MRVLATDMDGTFIPLAGNDENHRDLRRLTEFLSEREIELVYVTGRHYELVLEAIDQQKLPSPDWMICDVGTCIYHRAGGGDHNLMREYEEHLAEIVAGCESQSLQPIMQGIDGLRLQESEKQGRFKLSYYCDSSSVERCSEAVRNVIENQGLPYHIVASIDPFTDDGLIDLLPRGVTKAHALRWWTEQRSHDMESVMFAGDSGNDLAALTEGYRSIVVGNATDEIRNRVLQSHARANWTDRLFIAERLATSGVLDGVQYFTGM